MNTAKPDDLFSGKVALFCLTPGGVRLAQRIRVQRAVDAFTSHKLMQEGFLPFTGSFVDTVALAFQRYDALVVIGATGIVVRVIAPLLQDKLHDPAVVVLDEQGEHVISLLSGHCGGANALTRSLAAQLGARAVITTATDVNGVGALDLLAQKINGRLADFAVAVKTVNQLLVSGGRVGLWIDPQLSPAPVIPEALLRGFIAVPTPEAFPSLDALVCISLRAELPAFSCTAPRYKVVPRRLLLGTGCRRDTPFATLRALLLKQLAAHNLDPLALQAMASITLKQHEPALLALAEEYDLDFQVYSAEALSRYASQFPCSDFVRQTVGVGCVSQPAALLLSEAMGGGTFIGETLREQGVTLTLSLSFGTHF